MLLIQDFKCLNMSRSREMSISRNNLPRQKWESTFIWLLNKITKTTLIETSLFTTCQNWAVAFEEPAVLADLLCLREARGWKTFPAQEGSPRTPAAGLWSCDRRDPSFDATIQTWKQSIDFVKVKHWISFVFVLPTRYLDFRETLKPKLQKQDL